jgi:two-component system, chemotaxis family, chemotaxis protein CheY
VAHTVLIVDDTKSNRDLLAYLLGRAGYRVVVAENAIDGLAAAHRERPDVAIIDVFMPGGGATLARCIRNDLVFARMQLIAVSASHDQPMVKDAVHGAGFNAFFALPFDPEVLVDEVKAVLARVDE